MQNLILQTSKIFDGASRKYFVRNQFLIRQFKTETYTNLKGYLIQTLCLKKKRKINGNILFDQVLVL